MERKEEYLFLREEIMKNNSAAESYRNVMYTVTIALVTIAFSQKEPLLFLLPLCIILPAYKIIIDKLLGMCRIAAYLIVFLEGKDFNGRRIYTTMTSCFPRERHLLTHTYIMGLRLAVLYWQ